MIHVEGDAPPDLTGHGCPECGTLIMYTLCRDYSGVPEDQRPRDLGENCRRIELVKRRWLSRLA